MATVGLETAADRTDLDRDRLAALDGDDPTDLTLAEAAAVLALTDEWPDADTLLLEVRDTIMLRMSTAVMDVERLAADMEGDLDPTAVQQRIEGRHPMTLREYARVVHAVAGNAP